MALGDYISLIKIRTACYIIIVIGLFFQDATSAPKTKETESKVADTFMSPANLPYEELVYILQVRRGEDVKPRTLSPCARAILGCCKGKTMNSRCSEDLSCGAFFLDDNPCDDQFILSALKAAQDFYGQFQNPNTNSVKEKDS